MLVCCGKAAADFLPQPGQVMHACLGQVLGTYCAGIVKHDLLNSYISFLPGNTVFMVAYFVQKFLLRVTDLSYIACFRGWIILSISGGIFSCYPPQGRGVRYPAK